MPDNAETVAVYCRFCGEEIVQQQNPTGPEEWCEPGGYNWGCLQAAYDVWDGVGGEPQAPYPPHAPEYGDAP